ncbi:unnamed protein product [Amoebophrya sp. A120]|nr:unnamed protein product [Amoebophrya sp. A120]|eukprot:GSA120T00003902001.1
MMKWIWQQEGRGGPGPAASGSSQETKDDDHEERPASGSAVPNDLDVRRPRGSSIPSRHSCAADINVERRWILGRQPSRRTSEAGNTTSASATSAMRRHQVRRNPRDKRCRILMLPRCPSSGRTHHHRDATVHRCKRRQTTTTSLQVPSGPASVAERGPFARKVVQRRGTAAFVYGCRDVAPASSAGKNINLPMWRFILATLLGTTTTTLFAEPFWSTFLVHHRPLVSEDEPDHKRCGCSNHHELRRTYSKQNSLLQTRARIGKETRLNSLPSGRSTSAAWSFVQVVQGYQLQVTRRGKRSSRAKMIGRRSSAKYRRDRGGDVPRRSSALVRAILKGRAGTRNISKPREGNSVASVVGVAEVDQAPPSPSAQTRDHRPETSKIGGQVPVLADNAVSSSSSNNNEQRDSKADTVESRSGTNFQELKSSVSSRAEKRTTKEEEQQRQQSHTQLDSASSASSQRNKHQQESSTARGRMHQHRLFSLASREGQTEQRARSGEECVETKSCTSSTRQRCYVKEGTVEEPTSAFCLDTGSCETEQNSETWNCGVLMTEEEAALSVSAEATNLGLVMGLVVLGMVLVGTILISILFFAGVLTCGDADTTASPNSSGKRNKKGSRDSTDTSDSNNSSDEEKKKSKRRKGRKSSSDDSDDSGAKKKKRSSSEDASDTSGDVHQSFSNKAATQSFSNKAATQSFSQKAGTQSFSQKANQSSGKKKNNSDSDDAPTSSTPGSDDDSESGDGSNLNSYTSNMHSSEAFSGGHQGGQSHESFHGSKGTKDKKQLLSKNSSDDTLFHEGSGNIGSFSNVGMGSFSGSARSSTKDESKKDKKDKEKQRILEKQKEKERQKAEKEREKKEKKEMKKEKKQENKVPDKEKVYDTHDNFKLDSGLAGGAPPGRASQAPGGARPSFFDAAFGQLGKQTPAADKDKKKDINSSKDTDQGEQKGMGSFSGTSTSESSSGDDSKNASKSKKSSRKPQAGGSAIAKAMAARASKIVSDAPMSGKDAPTSGKEKDKSGGGARKSILAAAMMGGSSGAKSGISSVSKSGLTSTSGDSEIGSSADRKKKKATGSGSRKSVAPGGRKSARPSTRSKTPTSKKMKSKSPASMKSKMDSTIVSSPMDAENRSSVLNARATARASAIPPIDFATIQPDAGTTLDDARAIARASTTAPRLSTKPRPSSKSPRASKRGGSRRSVR